MSETEHHRAGLDGEYFAAEYALGVLNSDERRAAERRMDREPRFAAEVAAWQERLAPLVDHVAPVQPSPELWRRIEEILDARKASRAGIAMPAAEVRRKLAFWRGLAFGASGLAAASLAGLVLTLAGPPRPEAPTVRLASQEGGPTGIVATFDPRERTVLIVPAAPSATEQRVPELWLIPPRGTPRSLGVVSPGRPVTVALPGGVGPQEAGRQPTVAISLEPAGGSPSGVPTGPVIARGTLRRL